MPAPHDNVPHTPRTREEWDAEIDLTKAEIVGFHRDQSWGELERMACELAAAGRTHIRAT